MDTYRNRAAEVTPGGCLQTAVGALQITVGAFQTAVGTLGCVGNLRPRRNLHSGPTRGVNILTGVLGRDTGAPGRPRGRGEGEEGGGGGARRG